MNPYAFIPLAAFLINLAATVFALAQADRTRLRNTYVAFGAALSLYPLCEFVLWSPIPEAWIEPLIRVTMIGYIPLGYLFLRFGYAFAGKAPDRLLRANAIGVAVSLLTGFLTPWIIADHAKTSWGTYQILGPLFAPMVLVVMVAPVLYSLSLIGTGSGKTAAMERERRSLIVTGGALTVVTVFIANIGLSFVFPNETVIQLGSACSVFISLYICRAITGYRFLAITVEQTAETIFNHAHDGIVLLDAEGRVARANPAAEMLVGEALPVGADLGDALERSLDWEAPQPLEVVHVRNGETQHLSVTHAPCRRGAETLGRILVLRDVTRERLAAARLLRMNEELEHRVEERTRALREAEASLRRHLALEDRVLAVSSRFVRIDPDEAEAAIGAALAELGQGTGIDRVELLLLAPDRRTWSQRQAWRAPAVPPRATADQDVPVSRFAWAAARILAGEELALCSLADLPPEAEAERADCLQNGTRALLIQPFSLRDTVIGGLRFEMVSCERAWHAGERQLLRIAGEVFAHALGRAEAARMLRETEDQLRHAQKMEAVGRLAGGIAHDFNNVLCVINGYAELLRMQYAREETLHKSLEAIYRAGQRAAGLVRQLLIFSRKQVLEMKVVDACEQIRELAKMLKRLLGEQIEVRLEIPATPLLVRVDAGQLDQVVMNLAVNGRDAMPEGGVLTIRVTALALEGHEPGESPPLPQGPYVQIEVADTGQGIPPEVLPWIFEPFFTTKPIGVGTGLGLSIVYGIVTQHGGEIQVASEPGKGAAFRVLLPHRIVAEQEGELARLPEQLGGRETVLIVEDEEMVRDFAARLLRLQGYRVLEAEGPMVALAMLKAEKGGIDLLLTDVCMPQMSGPALAAEARAHMPGLRLLYMSGYAGHEVEDLESAGPGAPLVAKPFTPDELTRTVRKVLDA